MTTLYGIKNCDTVRKAAKWLSQQEISHEFHDFRVEGLTESMLIKWESHVGWEILLNKRSTSFRQLSDSEKAVASSEQAIALMLANPTLIKRPVLEVNGLIEVGFKPAQYEQVFKQAD
ncbi:ArsC family reductase [Corallincola platygyrae]|uniref:ArsC family reductase n=1 Tax=Corallincola platygyrae TaxID=1193278 RepID=A0ABW4XR41_9GAMM